MLPYVGHKDKAVTAVEFIRSLELMNVWPLARGGYGLPKLSLGPAVESSKD
jgi:hypothetical protein